MNTIDQKLIQKSQAIFDDLAKWNALLSLFELDQAIQYHWLAIGTKAMMEKMVPRRL